MNPTPTCIRPVSLAALLLAPVLGHGDEITLTPSADATLYESSVGNIANGAGDYLFSGRTNRNEQRRALLRFDLSEIPPGSTINDVTLTMNMSRAVSGPNDVSLRPVTQSWGTAGSNAGGQEGGGTVAQNGDATWQHRFFPNDAWDSPGGDFISAGDADAITAVDGNGQYQWSGPGMIATVQNWVDDAALNQGWIVLNDGGAKRFDSSENATNQPTLVVDFTTGPAFAINAGLDGVWTVAENDVPLQSVGVLIDIVPAANNGLGQDLFVGAWFTHDDPSVTRFPGTSNRWITLQGTFAPGSNTATFDLFQVLNGTFAGDVPGTTEQIGSGSATFLSCIAADFQFTLFDEEINEAWQLQRTFPDDIDVCSMLSEE